MQARKSRKSRKVAFGIVFFTVLSGALLSIEPLYTPTALITPNQKLLLPKYIAYKAVVSGLYKGNSRAAIIDAINSAVGGIELDIRLSKDKIPFIYHADTLEDLPTLKSKVPEQANWNDLKDSAMSLEEVFQMLGSDKYLFLDIKESAVLNNGFAGKVAALIAKYHLYDTVIVESFNPFFLSYMRLQSRDVLIMYDFVTNSNALGEEIQTQFNKIPWLLKQPFMQKQIRRILRPDIVGPRWNTAGSYLQKLIQHGYPVIVWTVDDSAIAKKLFSLGVTGIQSNQPLKLIQDLNTFFKQKVEDAGGTVSTIAEYVFVTKEDDVLHAIKTASRKNCKISIAGRKHSMGGQALLNDSIHLDMLGLNKVSYCAESKRITAQSGATWKKIQHVLEQNQRAVIIMQSDTIFTIGGSVSVNVHGWQVGMPPLVATIDSMKVATADGKIKKISATVEPELFKNVIGGYGQFAVILEVVLNTTANSMLVVNFANFPADNFEQEFNNLVSKNPKVELAYGRLAVDKDNLLQEAALYWYERTDSATPVPLEPERFVAIKRAIFRASEYSELGKKLRWMAEKNFAKTMSGAILSRNIAMSPDIHVLWPIRKDCRDILQEYFIPKGKMNKFIFALKTLLQTQQVNLLNVTIREVRQDNISNLPYANADVFAFVLLFSQVNDAVGEKNMHEFTSLLINAVNNLGGTFYLPYRLHYSPQQLKTAYPMLDVWLQNKKTFDPQELFASDFLQNLENSG